jgi:hypothetical protein
MCYFRSSDRRLRILIGTKRSIQHARKHSTLTSRIYTHSKLHSSTATTTFKHAQSQQVPNHAHNSIQTHAQQYSGTHIAVFKLSHNCIQACSQQQLSTVAPVSKHAHSSTQAHSQQYSGTAAAVFKHAHSNIQPCSQQYSGTLITVFTQAHISIPALAQQFSGTIAAVFKHPLEHRSISGPEDTQRIHSEHTWFSGGRSAEPTIAAHLKA